MKRVLVTLALVAAALPAAAQQRPAAPAQPGQPAQPAAPAAPITEPQRTTADFGDWTLRCDRPEGRPPICEVAQAVQSGNQTVAQMAIGRAVATEPLRLTLLVPVNVALGAPPRLSVGAGAPPLELGWQRCVPLGCLADRAMDEAALGRLRALAEPGRITFTDGAGREVALPYSPRGLAGALDALARQPR
jgi:invasion protein IalB